MICIKIKYNDYNDYNDLCKTINNYEDQATVMARAKPLTTVRAK